MASDFSHAGAFNVNGQWATAIRYEATLAHGAATHVRLRFVNGDNELADARLSAAEARELLGDTNHAAIVNATAAAVRAGHGATTARGELRGESLAFRQVALPGHEPAIGENTVSLDSRERSQAGQEPDPHAQADRPDRLTARDAVTGAAHVAQLAGAGGPGVHAAAQAIGAADAATLAFDAARGKPVRPVDAAAAASSATLAAGIGGPAGATVATLGVGAGAADTARRALNTADTAGTSLTDHDDEERDREEHRRRLARAVAVPDTVAERFLKVEDRYYFPDQTLAFIDRGTKLKAETHNREVIRSLAAIAEARGWQAVRVNGTPEFRRELWREASLRDIEVHGHDPTDVEREALRRAIEKRREANDVNRASLPSTAEPPAHEAAGTRTAADHPTPAQGDDASRPQDRPAGRADRWTGRLVGYGAAPYQRDGNGLSYFVKLQTDSGERVLWGVDLERAVVESQTQVKVGDEVTVEKQAPHPAMVKVARRDRQGRVIGEEDVPNRRNTWTVETPSYFAQRDEKAAAFRHGDAHGPDLVQRHPDLTGAVISLWLGEQFARQKVALAEDRERVVALVKERLAQALERGETVNAPHLKREVARHLHAARDVDESVAPTRAKAPQRATRPPREQIPDEPPHARA